MSKKKQKKNLTKKELEDELFMLKKAKTRFKQSMELFYQYPYLPKLYSEQHIVRFKIDSPIINISLSTNSNLLACGSESNVLIYNLTNINNYTPNPPIIIPILINPMVCFAEDNNSILLISDYKTVKVYEIHILNKNKSITTLPYTLIKSYKCHND